MFVFMRLKNLMATLLILCAVSQTISAEELTVYSSRNASYLNPLFDRYSAETGIAVRYVIDETAKLIRQLETEADESPADIFLTTGAMNLWLASQKGVLAPIQSKTLEKNIPAHLRSSENEWFAFAKRAEAIVYQPERVDEDELDTYAGLADAKWKGKLCLRSSRTEYSQSLLAALTQRLGKEQMLATAKGWVSNLAAPPFAEDLQIIAAVDQGKCDVGIINSYYLPRYEQEHDEAELALFWPDQDSVGVQLDITGAGVTAASQNKALATDLLEWLTTKEAQALYARLSMEYPVHPRVYPARAMAKHGKFKEDTRHIEDIAPYQGTASQLTRQAKYQ